LPFVLFSCFLCADVIACKKAGDKGRKAAGNFFGIQLFQQSTVSDVGGDDGGQLCTQPVVEQTVQAADEEGGVELRAKIIQNEQIGPGSGLHQRFLLACRVCTKVQPFQLGEKVRAGNIDHIVALFQHDARNGKGRMGLAKARIAKQHQALAVVVKLFRVAAQVCQHIGHVRADGTAHLFISTVRVIVQLHGVKACNGQAGQRLDLLAAQLLHHLVHALTGAAIHAAGVLTFGADKARLQCISGPSALCQQGGQLLLCIGKGGGSFVVNNLLPSMTDSLSMYFRLQGCTLHDLIQLRQSIELGAVREVIANASGSELIELGDCLDRYLNSSTTNERQLYDMNFHSVLVMLSKNTLYQYMLSAFNDIYSKDIYYSHQVVEDQGQLEESYTIHKELFKAICERNVASATEWMIRHFDFTQEDINRQTQYFFSGNIR
jgi:DNA-binding FadR family transcriptional regulator